MKSIDIVVPQPWSLFKAVESCPDSDNDLWCVEALWSAFWQTYIDVIVDFGV
jgi:hypothetical protein